MTSSYVILKEKKLVIDMFDGALTLENFKGHKLKQVAEKDFSPEYSLIIDFRFIEVRMTIEDVKEYAEFVAKRGDVIGVRKAAVIVKNPNQFIYAGL